MFPMPAFMRALRKTLREVERDRETSPDRMAQRADAHDRFTAYVARSHDHAEAAREGTRETVKWKLATGGAVIMASAAVFFVTVGRTKPPPPREDIARLGFLVDAHAGEIGQTISAATTPVQVRFSDGSNVRFEAASGGSVVRADGRGADVVLDRGTAHVAIRHRDAATRYRVHAGPFVVNVTGTEFDARWDAERSALRVTMQEGRVVIAGCGEERDAVKNESVELTCNPQAPNPAPVIAGDPITRELPRTPPVTPPRSPISSVPTAAPTTTSAPEPPPAPPEVAPTTTVPQKADPTIGVAREKAAAGNYSDAFGTVEKNFELLVDTASESDVWFLADCARLSSHGREAAIGYLRIRKRFPSANAKAAFFLGRIASDGGRLQEAAAWYESSVLEEPHGTLASDAMGRAMEARERIGDMGSARAWAKTYLERFAGGAHAAHAAKLMETK